AARASVTLSAMARICRGFVPEQMTKKSVNPVALRRSRTTRLLAFLSAAASIASEICFGKCVALRRFSTLAMQPACRRIGVPFIARFARREGLVKSVLLNVLLDALRYEAGNRLPDLPALSDGS